MTIEYVDTYQSIDSSAINQVWLTANGDVFIEFAGGSVAGYKNVGRVVYEDFIRSSSLGYYYNNCIKNRFSGLPGDTHFVKAGSAVDVTAAKPVANASRFEVVYDTGMVFSTTAVDETSALREAADSLSKFAGLKAKVVKVVHYFD